MDRTALWQHSSNSNIKIVHNSIDHFLRNLSDFSSDDVFSCLRIAFTNSVFQLPPSENSQASWDLGKRMARGYRFDVKWVGPMGSYAWSIQVFCSRKEVPPHFSNRNLNTSRATSHGTGSFCIKLITPDHAFPKISTCLTIFWGGFLKDRVCENNPQRREDIIRKEIRRIAQEMLNRVLDNFILLIQQRSAWNEHSINYWKSIVKHYWF